MIALAFFSVLGLAPGLALPGPRPPAGAQDPEARPAAVARLLAERCSECHSPGSDEPKATKHWPDARDLAGTLRDTDLVVAGEPDDSDLFLAVSFEDMPPPDSGVAPLSEQELALIEAWIRDGAALPAPEDSTDAAASQGSDRAPSGWLQSPPLRWVSHFHPMVVHFPVALLVAALLAELLARLSGSVQLRATATFCLALGTLAALPSAGLGWLLAANTSHHGSELLYHRWLGVSTAVLPLLVLWLGSVRPRHRLLMLLVLAGLVGATGHTGSMLVYGASWLEWPG